MQGIHRWLGGIYRSPVNSPSQRPVTRSFDVSLICARVNGRVNRREAVDLRRHRAPLDVIVMRGILVNAIRPGSLFINSKIFQSFVIFRWQSLILQKYGTYSLNPVHICQVAPQLSCQYVRHVAPKNSFNIYNGLSLIRRQNFTRTILTFNWTPSNKHPWNFNNNTLSFFFSKTYLKTSSAKCWSVCSRLYGLPCHTSDASVHLQNREINIFGNLGINTLRDVITRSLVGH